MIIKVSLCHTNIEYYDVYYNIIHFGKTLNEYIYIVTNLSIILCIL